MKKFFFILGIAWVFGFTGVGVALVGETFAPYVYVWKDILPVFFLTGVPFLCGYLSNKDF